MVAETRIQVVCPPFTSHAHQEIRGLLSSALRLAFFFFFFLFIDMRLALEGTSDFLYSVVGIYYQ